MTNNTAPRLLIEDWLPVTELGIESRRERAFVAAIPDLFSLHVWWARRPLVASAGVILASLLPPWSEQLAAAFPSEVRVDTEAHYKRWFLHLCGIWGDPVAGRATLDRANAEGRKIQGNGYGYKQAYKNSPNPADLDLLHRVLERSWGELPNVIDPTAGGGSIPYEAVRYGLPAHANDLNQVAAVTLRAGVETAATYGPDLADDLDKWGQILIGRLAERLRPYFLRANAAEKIVGYLHARSVACPRTGKPVPLAPNWWISKAKGAEVATRVVTVQAGTSLDEPGFEILRGPDAFDAEPDKGTISRGAGLSPWDGLVIDGDYIKAEAQAGRMGTILYAVAIRLPEQQANGKTKWVRSFRSPTKADHDAIAAAESRLSELLPGWLASGVIPAEEIEDGLKTSEPIRYGMSRWRDMFSPRQLLVHGSFIEEHHRIALELQDEVGGEKANALAGLLGLMTSKALNYNSLLASWHTKDAIIRPVFDRHDFSFKWSFSEFEGADALWTWAHERNVVNTRAIAQTLIPSTGAWVLAGQTIKGERSDLRYPVPARATVTRGSGGSLADVQDESQTLVCIDPPYYDNVMYGELSDFFGVWEQHTVGKVWPDLMPGGVADLKNEAVANPARFKEFGRRRNELATADYEAKMHAIFAECDRVLRPDGVMSVMFTHKRSEAWDTLGMALLEAGFSIETSWPVNTESEQSLHQAKKNSAASTIMLVCRKRAVARGSRKTFFEDVEADVRAAARDAAKRFEEAGIDGVDLLLATYGPALSVLSRAWPVYSSETDAEGRSRLLRPEEALGAAREEVVRLRKAELVGRDVAFDGTTDFVLIAWQTFRAEEFPYDEARRLALAIGGGDVETLAVAKVLDKKAGMVRLLSPKERKRKVYRPVLDGEIAGLPLVDVLHAVLIEASESSLGAAKALCDRLRLLEDQRFVDLIQAMVRAVPNTKVKGKWVRPEAEILNQFCTAYLPQVELPEDPASDTLFELD
jgi:adenine-specific DNA methylase